MSFLLPFFLNIGVTLSFFNTLGKIPRESDKLNKSANGLQIKSEHLIINIAGILSYPVDVVGSKLRTIFLFIYLFISITEQTGITCDQNPVT